MRPAPVYRTIRLPGTLPAAPQGKGHRGYTECDEHDGHQGGRLGIHTRLGILDDGFGGLEQPEVPQQDLAAAVIGEERNLLMLAAVEPGPSSW